MGVVKTAPFLICRHKKSASAAPSINNHLM